MSSLRVAVVTESFLPTVNGVTTSVCRVLEHLRRRGDQAVVICPGPAPAEYAGYPVVPVPAISYRQFPVGLPVRAVQRTLAGFAPDIVHAASPFVLGAAGLFAARRLGVPSVAVYQTDIAGYARRHHLAPATTAAWRWLRRVHAAADLTLAPSAAALRDLHCHGIAPAVWWGRGVDLSRFHPANRASPGAVQLRSRIIAGSPGAARAPGEPVIAGYVGRLAPEKRVERLATLTGAGAIPGLRIVIAGDGPSRPLVERAVPGAVFLGQLGGTDLADAYAAVDLFVHTGTEETFGQTIQEAMASGLPVVAPAAGGPLDLIQPGVTGLLYAPDDDGELLAAVAALAADPVRRGQFGRAGREQVLPRSWDALGELLSGHYRSVLSGRLSGVPTAAGPHHRAAA